MIERIVVGDAVHYEILTDTVDVSTTVDTPLTVGGIEIKNLVDIPSGYKCFARAYCYANGGIDDGISKIGNGRTCTIVSGMFESGTITLQSNSVLLDDLFDAIDNIRFRLQAETNSFTLEAYPVGSNLQTNTCHATARIWVIMTPFTAYN